MRAVWEGSDAVTATTLYGWAVFLALCAVMLLPIVAALVSDMLGMYDERQ